MKGNWIKSIALALALSIGLAAASFATAAPSISNSIPNGYMDGPESIKYGTYFTPVQPSARGYQDRLKELENKAYGLSQMSTLSTIIQSESAYWLEFQIIRLHIDIANAPENVMTSFERESLLYGTIRTYADVRHNSERLYENMVRYIDHALPGPNGPQIHSDATNSQDMLYYPNYRSDKELTDTDKAQAYQQKLQDFTKAGGSLQEIQVVTPEYLSKLGQYTRVEYVWMPNGEIRVTPGKAGHLLLAAGGPVKAAGQLVFIKDNQGKFTMLIVTNASGTYKPDLLSANYLAEQLQQQTQIASDGLVITKGEPLSTQAVKIYMKANHVDAADISKQTKELENYGKEVLQANTVPAITISFCASAFN